ncbi:TetR/AcrR family transcriptional regulator [Parahaliea sp. F7430]|uniref:TetR/AcrR family transcriptional regulator n=1 Tax=Sediminihaliea albiluteola TaxID=2758564 RepID=A0A7W2YK04_9GAMM|nr:TetR/AcrR family transcriptional regulator [Sediminihaliea albiluteola]MBA6413690.1 TetR/AcrR family transcriptional regulator [Sediminihaliea albiluteola]
MALKINPADIEAMGLQAAKSKATQDQIINAVIGLIKEEGFSAASSSRIAKRAGVTWGAVQHHFGGKEEILEEVLQRSHLKFHEALSASRFTTGTAERRVAKYVDAAWFHYQGDEYMATMEILLATRGNGKASSDLSISRSRKAHLALARRIFHDSEASDRIFQEVIYTVHCMLTGLLIEIALEPQSFEPKPYLKRLKAQVSSMLYG